MLERAIVAHGAPTLAGLKLGSLFNVALAELRVLEEEMQMLNAVLLPKGVALALLRTDAQRALLYLYRTSTLFQELQRSKRQYSVFSYLASLPLRLPELILSVFVPRADSAQDSRNRNTIQAHRCRQFGIPTA